MREFNRTIGKRDFAFHKHVYVMGILNVTEDSFSDGGKFRKLDDALYHVEEMIKEGMDILDVGGESTRPGFLPISEEEETNRIAPVIHEVKKRFEIPVSLDTYKYEVMKAGMEEGADLINDIWGLKADVRIAPMLARENIPCVLMHNRKNLPYQNFLEDIKSDLQETLRIAEKAGILKERIILDPGIGFAKTYEENLQLLNKLEELTAWDYPVLLGCSRKSVIGLTLKLPPMERLEGTLATTAIGLLKGCGIVRVHDVKENVRFIQMMEAVLQG